MLTELEKDWVFCVTIGMQDKPEKVLAIIDRRFCDRAELAIALMEAIRGKRT